MKTIDTNRDITSLLPSWVKEVVENKTYGSVEWDEKSVELYLSEKQKTRYISGIDLREEMKDKNPVNLAFLNFFVENPKFFPKEWRGRYVYGWGTIVRSDHGNLFVPYLCEGGCEVLLNWFWLDNDWDGYDPALRFASSVLGTPETRNLDLESAIRICKENNLKVYKEL